jgi:hypothetical protein
VRAFNRVDDALALVLSVFALSSQQTVHPKAVKPSFLDDDDSDRHSGHLLSLGTQACQQAEQPSRDVSVVVVGCANV